MIDRTDLLAFVADEAVLLVQEENAKLLALFKRHGGVAIFKNLAPGRQDLPAAQIAAQHALGEGGDELQILRHRIAYARHFLQAFRRRAKHLCNGAEGC